MSIIVAMPGKPELQQRFWRKCIVETGLEIYTRTAYQANAFTHRAWPHQLAEDMDTDRIALRQYEHTLPRYASEWTPKPFSYVYLDYEPRTIDTTWLAEKQRDGYTDTDIDVLRAMRRGVQEAIGADTEYSVYRTPVLPTQREINPFVVKSVREAADLQQWVWMDAYHRGDPITQDNLGDWHDRLVRDFGALSKLGRRVIPWIRPTWALTPHDCLVYGAATLKTLTGIEGIHHVGLWVDCNHASVTDQQIERTTMLAPYLRKFMES